MAGFYRKYVKNFSARTSNPDWKKKFILSTDASIQGLGATLSQMGPAGEQVIAYASRSLQDRPFDLITDHRALVKFKELKDTNPTLERWSIKLSALSRETEDIQEIQLESFNDAFIIKGDGRLYR